jgi:hypothetical protein
MEGNSVSASGIKRCYRRGVSSYQTDTERGCEPGYHASRPWAGWVNCTTDTPNYYTNKEASCKTGYIEQKVPALAAKSCVFPGSVEDYFPTGNTCAPGYRFEKTLGLPLCRL